VVNGIAVVQFCLVVLNRPLLSRQSEYYNRCLSDRLPAGFRLSGVQISEKFSKGIHFGGYADSSGHDGYLGSAKGPDGVKYGRPR